MFEAPAPPCKNLLKFILLPDAHVPIGAPPSVTLLNCPDPEL